MVALGKMPRKIWATVKPQATRQEVKQIADGDYLISVHAVARQGKANDALIEILADYFSIPKSSIRIVRGRNSRRKLLEIR